MEFVELKMKAGWVERAPLLQFQTSDCLILSPSLECAPLVGAYDR